MHFLKNRIPLYFTFSDSDPEHFHIPPSPPLHPPIKPYCEPSGFFFVNQNFDTLWRPGDRRAKWGGVRTYGSWLMENPCRDPLRSFELSSRKGHGRHWRGGVGGTDGFLFAKVAVDDAGWGWGWAPVLWRPIKHARPVAIVHRDSRRQRRRGGWWWPGEGEVRKALATVSKTSFYSNTNTNIAFYISKKNTLKYVCVCMWGYFLHSQKSSSVHCPRARMMLRDASRTYSKAR